jgi:hypothetical protein
MMWRLVYREAGIELRFDLDIHRLFWVARHAGCIIERARARSAMSCSTSDAEKTPSRCSRADRAPGFVSIVNAMACLVVKPEV